ncbi:MAG: TonB-dependent receptor [Terriglobales bacterium]
MRFSRFFIPWLLLVASGFASDLTVKVVDPQSAVVAGARVALYPRDSTVPTAVRVTGSDGSVTFRQLSGAAYRVEILAPGFAPARAAVSETSKDTQISVELALPTAAETVVVSAERTPLPSEETGADTSLLGPQALQAMQPVEAADALRFLPGAIVGASGRRGGQASLFVRGGDSRYNKVIVDGVTVNDPGGTFDFGVVPMFQVERLEFVRGAESTLYGSDAMTSVIQTWTPAGTTRTPELRFGAEGGTFQSARGYASLSGARGRLDYNLFGEQFNTQGQGINDAYSSSLQGANLGVALSDRVQFRLRTRHYNDRSGIQSFWNFNGLPLMTPDTDQFARQNNFLAGADLTIAGPSRWQHRITGFEYRHRRLNQDTFMDPGRVTPAFGNIDFPFTDLANINRAGVEYQGDYVARSWARTTVGYRFEDENGFVGDPTAPPLSHGLRRNHSLFGQEVITWRRLSLIGGLRFEHNETFGNKVIPRIAASLVALKGGEVFSGTRLRFAYGTGIKEPRLEESFAIGPFAKPNPNLKPEENRSFEAGLQQSFLRGKYWFGATYFNNLFTNRIDFLVDPTTFVGQYVNINRALAHGAEAEFRARPTTRLNLDASYTYTSTQILSAPLAFFPELSAGAPLIRRPKYAGSLLATYAARKWGANLGGTFVGRRPDSDFGLGLIPAVTHAAGYARVDLGGWYDLTHRVTAYVRVENAFNRHYEEAAGYPALKANFRAGMRFRVGGE